MLAEQLRDRLLVGGADGRETHPHEVRGIAGEHLGDVRAPEPDPGSRREARLRGTRRGRATHPHRSDLGPYARGCMLPLTRRSHVPFGTYTQASFWASRFDVPAHEELAVWQSLLPAFVMP